MLSLPLGSLRKEAEHLATCCGLAFALVCVIVAVGSVHAASASAEDDNTVTLEVRFGSVTFPKSRDIHWGFGDTPCGYGLQISLPAGTYVCFNEDRGDVTVFTPHPGDAELVAGILASAPAYRLVTPTPGTEQPPPTLTPTPATTTPPPAPGPPNTGTGEDLNGDSTGLASGIVGAVLSLAAVGIVALRGRQARR